MSSLPPLHPSLPLPFPPGCKPWMTGRIALVTGASSGIGAATCASLAAAGCSTIITLDLSPLPPAPPSRSDLHLPVDVSDEAAVREALDQVRIRFGRLDYVILNAGIAGGVKADLVDYPVEVFDRIQAVNVRGVFLCLKYAIPLLKRRREAFQVGGSEKETASNSDSSSPSSLPSPSSSPSFPFFGLPPTAHIAPLAQAAAAAAQDLSCHDRCVVITASTSSFTSMPGFCGYSVSKHAVMGIVRTAAAELAKDGVRVNCVCPGTTATSMVEEFMVKWPDYQRQTNEEYPLGRVMAAEEVAAAIEFILRARFMTGQSVVLDGGMGCRE